MRFYAVPVIVLLFTLAGFAQQNQPSLNQSLSEMFNRNFSEWQADDAENAFYPMIKHSWKFDPQMYKAEEASDLHSLWKKDRKEVSIYLDITGDSARDFNGFLIRNISPPSYEIKNLGDEAHLIKFYNRVEIAFVKFNVFTKIFYSFPSRYQKPPRSGTSERINAPPEEVEFAQKIARLIDAEITRIHTTETLTGVKIPQPKN